MKTFRACVITLALSVPMPLVSSGQGSRISNDGRPMICHNQTLKEAVKIIDRACDDITCDLSRLAELDSDVDKGTLLHAFRDPYLYPVHIFFPANESRYDHAFDWTTTKKAQIDSLVNSVNDPENAVVFILGHASVTGGLASDRNIRLSRERMTGIRNYLKDVLNIQCNEFRGAWFSNTILQMNSSDANMLNLQESDYRRDELILNQAVHVFIFPCGDLL